MRRARRLALACWFGWVAAPGWAAESVEVCYNYGCAQTARVAFSDEQLGQLQELLAGSGDPEVERAVLAWAVGRLYHWAGAQSPIHADQPGDLADEGVEGRMDCIDHATTTDHFLGMLESRGWLRFHRVVPVARRTRLVLFQHFSAVVEELGSVQDGDSGPPRFVIDSWFVEQGAPAVVLPLPDWLDGDGPNVQ